MKTAEEILKAEFVDGEWEELMSYMNTDITPSIIRAMEKHVDQFKPKWVDTDQPVEKELETVEEMASEYADNQHSAFKGNLYRAFIAGANWQKQKSK